MVWNTIAHPKMMTSGGGGDIPPEPVPGVEDSTMKNRPLLSVDTAKQSFYDFILNPQVVGYGESKVEGQPGDPIVKLILVHGNYQDIYNKLMNAQFVIGALVSLRTRDTSMVGQGYGQANITTVYVFNLPKHPVTVGGMPLIAIEFNDGESQLVYLDCLNRVWPGNDPDNVPPYDKT